MKRIPPASAAAVVLAGYVIGRGLGTFVVRSPMRSTTPKTSDIKATEKAVSYAEQGYHHYDELARQAFWIRLRRDNEAALQLLQCERDYCDRRARQLAAYLFPGVLGTIETLVGGVSGVPGTILGRSSSNLPTPSPATKGKRPARPYRMLRRESKAQRRRFRQLLKDSRAYQQKNPAWEDAARDMLYVEWSRNQRRSRSGFGLN